MLPTRGYSHASLRSYNLDPIEMPHHPHLPQALQASLCVNCRERRLITSGTGSIFLLCQRGVREAEWPKYPAQPVQQCPHFRGQILRE